MTTVIRGVIPASEFALTTTLERLSDTTFEIERIVRSGADALMPLLWVRGADRDEIEEAFDADPTVDQVSLLADFDDERLYRMEWVDHVHLLIQMLTKSNATILDAYGRNDHWQVRVLYPSRNEFTKTHDFCDQHGFTLDVESIRELDGDPSGRFGLTDRQYHALSTAAKEGYYAVPQEITLQDLADQFDVSHQALSERLRRGTATLVEDALLVAELPETVED